MENDNDYQSEDSGSDVVDSDFSIDENDEVKSDEDDDAIRRKRGISTKAYKVFLNRALNPDKSCV